MSTKKQPKSAEITLGHVGRVTLITGGAQGIGEACARRFASEGAHVVIADVDDVRGSELAEKGIRVNAVAPGTIATELAAKAVLTSDEARAKIMSRTPMKRLGEPAEIADVVAWLASDAASYVTGEIVVVDGGRMTLNYTVPV